MSSPMCHHRGSRKKAIRKPGRLANVDRRTHPRQYPRRKLRCAHKCRYLARSVEDRSPIVGPRNELRSVRRITAESWEAMSTNTGAEERPESRRAFATCSIERHPRATPQWSSHCQRVARRTRRQCSPVRKRTRVPSKTGTPLADCGDSMRMLVTWNSEGYHRRKYVHDRTPFFDNSWRPRGACSEKLIRETCKVDPARTGCEAFGFGESPAKVDVIAFSRVAVFRGDSMSSELHSRKIADLIVIFLRDEIIVACRTPAAPRRDLLAR